MTEFKYFRSTLTGKVGQYPENFGDLFDNFIEVDSNAADCVDCWLTPEDDEDLESLGFVQINDGDDDFPDPVVVSNDKNKDK